MVMQQLRSRNFMKGALWLILILTIPSFVLFYGYSDTGGGGAVRQQALVTVHAGSTSRELTRNELMAARDELANYYTFVFAAAQGTPPNARLTSAIESALSNRDVAEFAVSRVGLQQRLAEQQILVSPEQVARRLANQGVTKENLDRILQSQRMSEAQFLMVQKDVLRADRGRESVSMLARTSLPELWQEYQLTADRLTGAFVRFGSQELLDAQTVSDAEVKEAYDRFLADPKLRRQLRKGAERVYQFVYLPPPPTRIPALPGEAEIRAAYNAAPTTDDSIWIPGGSMTRHILVSMNMATATEEEKAAARAQLEAARQRILLGGEAFEVVANEVSTDIRNTKFDDSESSPTLLGGLMPRAITEADAPIWGQAYVEFATKANIGETSAVMETPQGMVVARLEARGDMLRRDFELVREELGARLLLEARNKAREERTAAAQETLKRVREVVARESTLEGIARELQTDVRTTSPTAESARFIPEVGSFSRESAALDLLEKGDVTPALLSDNEAVAVLRLAEVFAERDQTIEEARTFLQDQVRREKAVAEARRRAEEFRGKVGANDRLTTVALGLNLPFVELSTEFTRAELPTELRNLRGFENRSLALRPMQTMVFPEGIGAEPDSFLVFQLLGRREPAREEFFAQLRDLERNVIAAKQQGFLEDFYRDSRERLRAEYNPDFIGREAPRR